MSVLKRLAALTGLTTVAAMALAVPASATTVSSTTFRATILEPLTVTVTLLGSPTTASCPSGTMSGTLNTDGTGLSVTSASIGACSGSVSATVTPENLPWSGGNVVYTNDGIRDREGTVTMAGFRVKAVVNVLGGITCIYGGALTGDAYNGANPNRPVASSTHAQAKATNVTVNKINSGSNFFCPGSASVSGVLELTDGSGNLITAGP
ncbi:hypothetical protein [Actinocorallia populi]|uniref:hypothetical protein n=1 Tax=Actinocorallia populi TaxID=2079200 RepID=UPI000D08C260|nr:hypothetical protein [Actinocorallia populi]